MLLIDRSPGAAVDYNDSAKYTKRVVVQHDMESATVEGRSLDVARSGEASSYMDEDRPFLPIVRIPYEQITTKDHAWIRVRAYVFVRDEVPGVPVFLNASFEYDLQSYAYRSFNVSQSGLKANEWNLVDWVYLTPEVRTIQDELKVHFWNQGGARIWIDDIEVSTYEPVHQY